MPPTALNPPLATAGSQNASTALFPHKANLRAAALENLPVQGLLFLSNALNGNLLHLAAYQRLAGIRFGKQGRLHGYALQLGCLLECLGGNAPNLVHMPAVPHLRGYHQALHCLLGRGLHLHIRAGLGNLVLHLAHGKRCPLGKLLFAGAGPGEALPRVHVEVVVVVGIGVRGVGPLGVVGPRAGRAYRLAVLQHGPAGVLVRIKAEVAYQHPVVAYAVGPVQVLAFVVAPRVVPGNVHVEPAAAYAHHVPNVIAAVFHVYSKRRGEPGLAQQVVHAVGKAHAVGLVLHYAAIRQLVRQRAGRIGRVAHQPVVQHVHLFRRLGTALNKGQGLGCFCVQLGLHAGDGAAFVNAGVHQRGGGVFAVAAGVYVPVVGVGVQAVHHLLLLGIGQPQVRHVDANLRTAGVGAGGGGVFRIGHGRAACGRGIRVAGGHAAVVGGVLGAVVGMGGARQRQKGGCGQQRQKGRSKQGAQGCCGRGACRVCRAWRARRCGRGACRCGRGAQGC